MRNTGNIYEEKAVEYLISQAYEIIDRNIYVGHKEIDILCVKDEITIFVEVKYTKTNHINFFPFLYKKKLYICDCAPLILKSEKYKLPPYWRIDFLYFCDKEIFHFTNI
jgi:Holliday junction resolvase-like predicted endonuclease